MKVVLPPEAPSARNTSPLFLAPSLVNPIPLSTTWHSLHFSFSMIADPSHAMWPKVSPNPTFLSHCGHETHIWWAFWRRECHWFVSDLFAFVVHGLWSQSQLSTLALVEGCQVDQLKRTLWGWGPAAIAFKAPQVIPVCGEDCEHCLPATDKCFCAFFFFRYLLITKASRTALRLYASWAILHSWKLNKWSCWGPETSQKECIVWRMGEISYILLPSLYLYELCNS